MKTKSVMNLWMLLALTACGERGSHEPKPAAVPSSEIIDDEAPLDEEVFMSTVSSSATGIEIEFQIKQLGCTLTPDEGLVNCPDPATLDELDARIGLLNEILTLARLDPTLYSDIAQFQRAYASIYAEVRKLETSTLASEAVGRANRARRAAFLNRNLSGDAGHSFTFQQKIDGSVLFQKLSQTSEFGQLIVDRGIDRLVMSNTTAIENFGIYRSLKVRYDDTPENVINLLLTSHLRSKPNQTPVALKRNEVYFNRNIDYSADLSQALKIQGLQRIEELKNHPSYQSELVRLKISNVIVGNKTQVDRVFGQNNLTIDAQADSDIILASISKM